MHVAVLYTGQLRTIHKTLPFFKQFVLLHPNVHIFACLQDDAPEKSGPWIRQQLGDHLKSLQWFNPQDSTFIHFREHLLHDLEIEDNWKHYLRTSGSIIEHYQTQLSYQKLFRFESNTGQQYDYIIRCRCDTIFCKPIDFHWLNFSEHDIQNRLARIEDLCANKNIQVTSGERFDMFMNTLLHKSISMDLQNPSYRSYRTKTFLEPQSPAQIQTFLKDGRYILTFRTNLLYIVKREYFYLIPCLGTMYSLFKFPLFEHPHWFNSETQFQAACYYTDLTIFDYESTTESDSLYKYDPTRYFTDDGQVKSESLVYVLVRH